MAVAVLICASGRTALHLAAEHGQHRAVEILLGARSRHVGSSLFLCFAMFYHFFKMIFEAVAEICRAVVDFCNHKDIKTKMGWTPLHVAAFHGQAGNLKRGATIL